MNNLNTDGWFCYYKGMIYANRGLDIQAKIANKAAIERELAQYRPDRGWASTRPA